MRLWRSVFVMCLLVVVGAAPGAAQGPAVLEDVGTVVAVVDPATATESRLHPDRAPTVPRSRGSPPRTARAPNGWPASSARSRS